MGTIKALDYNAPLIVAIVMGMMTASFGPLIRDGLLGRPPVLLEPNIYVTAALVGAAGYSLLDLVSAPQSYALPVGVVGAFLLGAMAIIRDWRLPKYRAPD